ncbi:MAG: YggS family pyridoxal phosphate-dependent enzyme [Thermoguttaceae bacterium]|jgi:pyridoxal phosphate enzyme (YggS family)|nr:YggS family pyridoxal phosphate-dependent enzyme [Thermoguttaceae bacterium]
MPDLQQTIEANLARVRADIARAAARAGRKPEEVKLIGVTKYVGAEVVRPLVAAGLCDLAESRPQQLWDKATALADLLIRWHQIGHLQRNKVRRTLPLVAMIESVDSLRLAGAVDLAAGELGRRIAVLLEVNISGEEAKHGFLPSEVEAALSQLAAKKHLDVRGLMGMAGLEGDLDDARREFAALRALRDRLQPACPDGIALTELSMGMSGDFEVAIEEGATIVRVGSALFEGLLR